MACTGTPCARCWPTPCRRATGGGPRPGVLTLRQAQEEPFTGVIDRILEDDLRLPRKQRHTAKRISERLRDKYGFDGGYTTVKDDVRENRCRSREMSVPLSHPPGRAQCGSARPGGHWWSGAEGPLLRPRPAPERRLLCEDLPGGDHRGVKISMDGKGRYQGNIFVERLWRTVKYEEVYLKAYVNAVEARRELGAYFRFYNNLRPHQALGYQTPAEVFHGEQDVRSEDSKDRRCAPEKGQNHWQDPHLTLL